MADGLTEQLSPLQQVERDEIAQAFRDVFQRVSGKRVLFWMLEQCAIYEDAYAGENINATNYTLGRQSAGRRLIGKLDELDPVIYPQLLRDIAEIRETDRAAAKAAADRMRPEDEY